MGWVRDFDFSPSPTEHDGNASELRWRNAAHTIAIEVEIDWREWDLFLLVVRLESGRLPDGYYVSSVGRCRLHLTDLMDRGGWIVSTELVDALAEVKWKGGDPAYLVGKLRAYGNILRECIGRLNEAPALFDDTR